MATLFLRNGHGKKWGRTPHLKGKQCLKQKLFLLKSGAPDEISKGGDFIKALAA